MQVRRLLSPLRRIHDRAFDAVLGIHTTKRRPAVGTSDEFYESVPTPYFILSRVLRRFALTLEDVFVDIGCGSGRAVALAATRRIRLAIGVELSAGAVDEARANLTRLRGRNAPAQIVLADAVEFDYSEATKLFLFNPFGERTLRSVLEAIGLSEGCANHVSDVVSCPGADYCSLAVTRSMGMAERIRDHLATIGLAPEEVGEFRVKISGCPNSCGQHHVGDVGLTGMLIKGADGRERPYYSLLVGGAVGEEGSSLGQRLGRYPEELAPRAIVAVARCYQAERTRGESFPRFVRRVGIERVGAAAKAAVGDGVR